MGEQAAMLRAQRQELCDKIREVRSKGELAAGRCFDSGRSAQWAEIMREADTAVAELQKQLAELDTRIAGMSGEVTR